MPVVDNENRLVGIITVDDIVDVIEEEATEDMEKMAALVPSDKPYMRTSVWETYKKRIPWLLLQSHPANPVNGPLHRHIFLQVHIFHCHDTACGILRVSQQMVDVPAGLRAGVLKQTL